MADVFISYRNTPERRAYVKRLALMLRAHDVSVWWDYGLAEGESYRAQITAELSKAGVVAPLWCSESITSKWVIMESELGKDKLVPARLQNVMPPDAFEGIHAADLIGWDGSVAHSRALAFVRKICERLGKPSLAPADMMEELADLRLLAPLPEPQFIPPEPVAASPQSDFAFWRGEWEAHRASTDPAELGPIVAHAPPYFAEKAQARLDELQAAREQARLRAEGRIPVTVRDRQASKEVWVKPGAGETVQDCWEQGGKRVYGSEMVVVPAGRFMMGSTPAEIAALTKEFPEAKDYIKMEAPQHQVTIAVPFAVGRHAVTFDDWDAAVAAGGVAHKPDAPFGRGRQPVVNVSWADATAYCEWLSNVTRQTYRLLSEAEWEYAARAGTTTTFWWGPRISTDQANYDGNHTIAGSKMGEYRQKTVPVDSFQPNPWGLYQVHGNVWEWCADPWHDSYKGAPTDGSVWQGGDATIRVVRGGSWIIIPWYLRSADRFRFSTGYQIDIVGFRVARFVSPPRTP